MTDERHTVIDYIYPLYIDSLTFVSPQPTYQTHIDLLKIFHPIVWILLIISILLLFFVFNYFNQNLWTILIALMRQTIKTKLIKCNKIRLLLGVWLISCLVLTTSFAGLLYSQITCPIEITVETIDDLSREVIAGNMRILATNGGSFYTVFKVIILVYLYKYKYYQRT